MSAALTSNIASHLPVMAEQAPAKPAIVVQAWKGGQPSYAQLTFAELNERCDRVAFGLEAAGIKRGTRTVLMVPPTLEFFPLVFGLFKVGAVVVLIDPGIGRGALLSCLNEVEPEAFIGVPAAHLARVLFPRPFAKVQALVTVGSRWFWGGTTLSALLRGADQGPYPMAAPGPDETAAILFTSGSTGIPKGVVYTHGMLDAQVRLIREAYAIAPGEVDLATFPLFALFDPALGMTSVIPAMDARFPARAEPERLLRAIADQKCTSMFGSPALLDRLSRHCEAGAGGKQWTLSTLKRVLSAGAPVRIDVMERMGKLLGEGAELHTPFGATESLPVATIGHREVLRDCAPLTAQGAGVCVGRPVPGAVVRIIRISDAPIAAWSDDLLAPPGEVGEITVKGPQVTRSYHARPDQTALAKIQDGVDTVHRMGDVGYFDALGRLWMCGRKGHRVETAKGPRFSVRVEEVLNAHPAVKRTALVGVGPRGQQQPVVLVEREPGHEATSDAQLLTELKAMAAKVPACDGVTDVRTYQGAFPVDVRHNAKIEREKLARQVTEGRA